ncbi:MAG: hypothetical protein ACLUPK_00785 [Veillonella sp.]
MLRLYRLDHRYEGRDTYPWSNLVAKASTCCLCCGIPNGATVEQFNAWVDANLAPFPERRDALRQWIADTGGMAGSPTSWYKENKTGAELQWTRQLDKHDIIANIDFSRSKLNSRFY